MPVKDMTPDEKRGTACGFHDIGSTCAEYIGIVSDQYGNEEAGLFRCGVNGRYFIDDCFAEKFS